MQPLQRADTVGVLTTGATEDGYTIQKRKWPGRARPFRKNLA
jgi:hypothetical protein